LKDIPIILTRLEGYEDVNLKNLLVRKGYILAALIWLRDNNFLYHNMKIDYTALDSYPEFKYLTAKDLNFVTLKRSFDCDDQL
jgi:hypothetical protein